MPARDIALFRRGLDSLRADGLKKIAAGNRRMAEPLVEALRNLTTTGNDQADLKALRDSLPALFDQMDDTQVVDWAEPLLLQTSVLARLAAIPEDIEELIDEDGEGARESLADTLEAGS